MRVRSKSGDLVAAAQLSDSSELSGFTVSAAVQSQLDELAAEEEAERALLPTYMRKLVQGYEYRVYYFEIVECIRKLTIVCLPVFFSPAGSPMQLIFGLMVCFISFGMCAPPPSHSTHPPSG